MRHPIRTVTPIDQIEPVLGLAVAKLELRIDSDDEDEAIEQLVLEAQDLIERHTSQVLTEREMEIAFGGFPPVHFEIPRTPVTEIGSIAFTDAEGIAAELAEADWRWSEAEPALVRPAYGTSWPSAYAEAGSVRIGFTAGYEAGLCPPGLVRAVKRLIVWLYDNRGAGGEDEATLPAGVIAACLPFRRVTI